MKEQVQHKIDEILMLAKTSGSTASYPCSHRPDSLSQIIRTEKDAELFMAKMEAAFKVAQSR